MQRICRGFLGLVVVLVMLLSADIPAKINPCKTLKDPHSFALQPAAEGALVGIKYGRWETKKCPRKEPTRDKRIVYEDQRVLDAACPEAQKIMTAIENRQEPATKRETYFEKLKQRFPAVALQFARKQANAFTVTERQLIQRMQKPGVFADPKDRGDFNIAVASVELVLKTGVREYKTPDDKARYIIQTVSDNNWISGTGYFIRRYCGNSGEHVRKEFSAKEDLLLLRFCKDTCGLKCMKNMWERHWNDWSHNDIALKIRILESRCSEHQLCDFESHLLFFGENHVDGRRLYVLLTRFISWWTRHHPVSSCRHRFDRDCLEAVNNHYRDDWSSASLEIKKRIISYRCLDAKACHIRDFLQRLKAPDDKETRLHFSLLSFFMASQDHCLPYSEVLQSVKETGNEDAVIPLSRYERPYKEKQCGFCDKH